MFRLSQRHNTSVNRTPTSCAPAPVTSNIGHRQMSNTPEQVYLDLMAAARDRLDAIDKLASSAGGDFACAEAAAFQGRKPELGSLIELGRHVRESRRVDC